MPEFAPTPTQPTIREALIDDLLIEDLFQGHSSYSQNMKSVQQQQLVSSGAQGMTNPSIDWAEFNKRKPLVFNVVSSVLNREFFINELNMTENNSYPIVNGAHLALPSLYRVLLQIAWGLPGQHAITVLCPAPFHAYWGNCYGDKAEYARGELPRQENDCTVQRRGMRAAES